MDHNEAHTTQATERYLLDDMAPGERDAFEDHFFDCAECAADVKDGAVLMAAGRLVAREGATVHPMPVRRGWTAWVPQAAAAAIISGVVGWTAAVQTIVPKAASIETLQPVEVELGENRGPGTAPQQTLTAGNAYSLNFFIPPHDDAASYVVRVRDQSGKDVYREDYSRERAAEPVSVWLSRELPRGSYEMAIEGVRKDGNPFPIASKNITLVGER